MSARYRARLLFALLSCALALIAGSFAASETAIAADSVYWANGSSPGTHAWKIRVGDLDGGGTAKDLFTTTEGAPNGLAIDPVAAKIYWTNYKTSRIRVGNLSGSGMPADLFTTSEGGPNGVATYPAAGKIYWSGSSKLRVGNLNGTGTPTDLFSTADDPTGVAIDPAAGKIYWASYTDDKIRVGNLNGSGTPADLFPTTEDSPSGVAIDPAAGKIYWANNKSGKIRVGNLNGSGTAADLFPTAEPAGPVGVAIDPPAGKIYWTNFVTGKVRVGNLNGTGTPHDLFSSEDGPSYLALLRAPRGLSRPSISGGSRSGASLSCSRGKWAGDLLGAFLYRSPHSFTYQWLRDGATILGAKGSSYYARIGGKYRCRVTASNAAGPTQQTSAPHPVKPPKPKITKTNINHVTGDSRVSFRSKGATGFQCALIRPGKKGNKPRTRSFSKCKSPKNYKHLKPGKYTFEVRVTSLAGPGPVAKKRFPV